MTSFKFNLGIKAATQTEAGQKANALAVLGSKLTVTELSKLADIVKNDPAKTALAKKYLGV